MALLMGGGSGSSVRLFPLPLVGVVVGVIVAVVMVVVMMVLANIRLSFSAISCGANSS